MWEFLGKLKDKVKETKDKLTKSPEELASQKFDEIFDEINKNGIGSVIGVGSSISVDGFSIETSDKDWVKYITIYKDAGVDKNGYHMTTEYSLSKSKFTWFSLKISDGNMTRDITDITPQELINEVLPKFQKRLNEAKILKAQERQRAFKEVSGYAQAQDQKEADDLLKWLDDLRSLA